MDQWAFFDALKAGKVNNVYLFYGPEAFIRRSALAALEKKTMAPGLESMNRTVLSSPTAQQIIESCETLPMMSDYRLIIVRDCALLAAGKVKDEAQESEALCAYLPRVPQTTCLVFDAGEAIDKRKKLAKMLAAMPGAVSFDTLDDVSLFKWMNQQLRPLGKRMDRAACEALAFTSGRDLTLLGGEPFEPQNQRALYPFLEMVKKQYPNKSIWCFTGYTLESDLLSDSRARCEVTDKMLSLIDVLVDGEFVEELKDISLRFKGSSNQRLIDLKKTLADSKIHIWNEKR